MIPHAIGNASLIIEWCRYPLDQIGQRYFGVVAAGENSSALGCFAELQSLKILRKIMMRILTLISILLSTSVFADESTVIRLSEPVQVTETHEVFGSELPEDENILSLSELIDQSETMSGQDVLVETEIAQVCQKKGCFFIARDGDAVARVRFKDYGFFIPTDAGGKTVVLAGALSKVELTPDQAAHFAEDLGQPAPAADQPLFEYQITATAVRIPL